MFVHRVDGVPPGLYLLLRDPDAFDRLRARAALTSCGKPPTNSCRSGAWPDGDTRSLAARLSCDQDIAADGFFSLGMLADFDVSLEAFGPSFYRHLFWETGHGGTGALSRSRSRRRARHRDRLFFDDPVHDVLGLRGHAFQSLYHFTVGMPVDDGRLTTEPGYPWG